MAEPVVYVNGQKAGEWKNGYSSFNVDVTPYVHKDGSPNTLAVHLTNVEESSRWYPGAGIIRPVKLIQTPKSCLSEWGLSATTIFLDGHSAYEELSAELEGLEKGKEYAVEFKIKGEKSIMTFSKQVWGDGQVKIVEKIENVKP